ncbi:myeloid differentiation primary response protein MyD88 isoform X2 [Scaptodrosophila lebanonensis]|uniref:Myeloid differentiation primary response protein MyD88 isoform X2 n=1 Tax=Drosophila lebanonensis TaxID=7225 RepID=A0A6J2TEU4_DROLE|nr:myeloid differentiation primary response protein MyD88 isoform X2 [Scaptodrosophila lebanonensis]
MVRQLESYHTMNEEDQSGGGFNETPLNELSAETRKQLACMLNRKKVLRSEEGYERDWRGIATLARQANYIPDQTPNPMELVLRNWTLNNPETATFGHLEKYLGIIDRWDVRDDIQENMTKDTQIYNNKQRLLEHARECPSPIRVSTETNNNHLGRDINILTAEDVTCLQQGRPLPTYNACVLYAEADIEHATEIMRNLEDPRYNFKLFLKHRDLLGGVPFEHVELSNFMATRCNHLIVVLTDEFLKSPENKYLVNFTHKLQIENQTRKIIQIVYNHNMVIPHTLAIYTYLNYAAHSSLYNFWDKLAKSLFDLDSLSIYTSRELYAPSAPETIAEDGVLHISLPETPRILLNDKDVTDMPLTERKSMEPALVTMTGDTSAPIPELKLKKKDKLLQKLTLNFNTTPSGTKKPLRHAYSTNGINMPERERTLSASNSNLSTTSESKKSSIKWRPKILKKVFTRSSTKLQVPS